MQEALQPLSRHQSLLYSCLQRPGCISMVNDLRRGELYVLGVRVLRKVVIASSSSVVTPAARRPQGPPHSAQTTAARQAETAAPPQEPATRPRPANAAVVDPAAEAAAAAAAAAADALLVGSASSQQCSAVVVATAYCRPLPAEAALFLKCGRHTSPPLTMLVSGSECTPTCTCCVSRCAGGGRASVHCCA